jgi:hypothetical protein
MNRELNYGVNPMRVDFGRSKAQEFVPGGMGVW